MSTQTNGFWTKALSIVTAICLIMSIIISAINMRTTTDEIKSRMRPWVGITDATFEAAPTTDASGNDHIFIDFDNVGNLPAQNLRFVQVNLKVDLDKPEPSDVPIPWQDDLVGGTVLPHEPCTHTLMLLEGTNDQLRITDWRTRKLSPILQGTIKYEYGETKYDTTFEVVLDFEKDLDSPEIYWKNTSAQ